MFIFHTGLLEQPRTIDSPENSVDLQKPRRLVVLIFTSLFIASCKNVHNFLLKLMLTCIFYLFYLFTQFILACSVEVLVLATLEAAEDVPVRVCCGVYI